MDIALHVIKDCI